MISIVTVHYNEFSGLRKTLDSINKFDCTNKIKSQWIVIDGGSLFDEELLAEIKGRADVFISEKDGGTYDAMNKSLPFIENKFCVFMNAGDVFVDDFRISDSISNDSNMIWMDSYEGYGVVNYKKCRGVNSLWYGMPTHHQAVIFKSSLVKKFGYNIKYRIGADYDLICKIAKLNLNKITIIYKPMCIFYLGGSSTKNFNKGLREQYSIRKNVLEISDVKNVLIFAIKHAVKFARVNFSFLYKIARYKNEKL